MGQWQCSSVCEGGVVFFRLRISKQDSYPAVVLIYVTFFIRTALFALGFKILRFASINLGFLNVYSELDVFFLSFFDLVWFYISKVILACWLMATFHEKF